jgi:Flp pilus assembly pilin Flp
MSNTALAVVEEPQDHPTSRPALRLVRDEVGATTAEYATVTGCGVGFAAVLFKFLTSSAGQDLLKLIFNAIKALLPF